MFSLDVGSNFLQPKNPIFLRQSKAVLNKTLLVQSQQEKTLEKDVKYVQS